MNVLDLARPEIVALKAYSHASWDPAFERLHANELPWRAETDPSRAGLNRYPDPHPHELAARLAELYGVKPAQLLPGRGSDESIDLLLRGFCRAGVDNVVIGPPTFGMYAVAARIQGVTLHCYRYAWAERAARAGYPIRWAQAALGHKSEAVHQAYAKKAGQTCPSLEEFERKIVPIPLAAAQ